MSTLIGGRLATWVYGLQWTGNYTFATVVFENRNTAEREAERRNKKVHWLRRKCFNLKWKVVCLRLIHN